MTTPQRQTIVEMVRHRTDEVVGAMLELSSEGLAAASELPGWSRLTVACHLRYGAQATSQMIDATLRGRASAFYPGGRDLQRPRTLAPALGESANHVPRSLADSADALQRQVEGLSDDGWDRPVIPADDDLTDITIGDLVQLRLTEVMVHGSDLGLGLAPWDPRFGEAAIEQRVRRMRCTPAAQAGEVRMVLRTHTGDCWTVSVDAEGGCRGDAGEHDADVCVTGPATALVALLLGRQAPDLVMDGDSDAARGLLERLVGP